MIGGAPTGGLREINVVPLVDVMLVLLIVFMVTAPLLDRGIEVELPEPGQTDAPPDEGAHTISVTADGRVFVDGALVEGELAPALRGVVQAAPDAPVSVRADRAARYESVAAVVTAAADAGIHNVTLVVDGG